MAINDCGEFSAFYQSKPYGIPSPIEQNRRHIAVLDAILKSHEITLPKRLGIKITPSIISLVLVSKNARITRPEVAVDGLDCVMKNDQLKQFLDKENERASVFAIAKVIGSDTLFGLAQQIAELHTPIQFDWAAKFGTLTLALEPEGEFVAPATIVRSEEATVETSSHADPAVSPLKKSKLICATCNATVSYSVAKFCWFNKPRFGGKIYCMECQKTALLPADGAI